MIHKYILGIFSNFYLFFNKSLAMLPLLNVKMVVLLIKSIIWVGK